MAREGSHSRLVLAAMIFAVAMTFIDQTIVAIAVPELQKDLSLSSTGVQWVVNGYLLSLSALFALGGRLADIAGHRRMVIVGVVGFATASGLCGATPEGSGAEAWLISFRVIQGAFAALMFPAALAIVVSAYQVSERGKALALFFGITGGLTAVGPLAGGYLTAIDWRAIFWVNIPVAIIALVLIVLSKPADDRHPASLDWRGAILVSGGMGLAVLGLQESSDWGWGDPLTWLCIGGGLVLLAVFAALELRTREPLMPVRLFGDRGFAVDNAVLFLLSAAFVPLFFFASLYAQLSLGQSASETGLYLLIFFAGFGTVSQYGGRILDKRGARASVVPGLPDRRDRVRALGLAAARPGPQQPVVLHRARRSRGRPDPGPGQHRRRQPRAARELRRRDRSHPDRAQLRRQPGHGRARHDPDPAQRDQHRGVARERRPERRAGQERGGCGQPRRRWLPERVQPARRGRSQEDLRGRAARLRPLHAHRLLRDGRRVRARLHGGRAVDAGRPGGRAGARRAVPATSRAAACRGS